MDHVGVLLVGLDRSELLLQFDGDRSIRCDAKSTFEKHLAVLGNNTCMSIVEVRGIGHCFPSNRCCLACVLMRNAIGPPRARATIDVGIAGGATFLPEDPSQMSGSVVVPAVPVVIVSATVIASVAVVVFIVGVLPVALLSSCPPCPLPDHRRRHLAHRCRCR